MNEKTKNGATGVIWDLSDLYQGIDDPRIKIDLEDFLRQALEFEKRERGVIQSARLTAKSLEGMLLFLEQLFDRLDKMTAHAYLVFAGDSLKAENGKHLQMIQEKRTEIKNHLLFFELEWVALSDGQAERLLMEPVISRYRHYLVKERLYRPHRLTEGEEKILALKNNTGTGAFSRLFDETLNRIQFEFNWNGEKTFLSEQEVLAILHDPDREKRKMAAAGLTKGLKENRHILTYIFNVIVADHASDDQLRAFPDSMASRHLSNEIDSDSVRVMMQSVEENTSTVHRYYTLKKKLMNLDVLYDYDRYAPLFKSARYVKWEEAKEIVLASFRAFSPEFGNIAELFFKNRWIDAEIRPGKQGGAFSYGVTPTHHPYILMNYTGNLRDVMTLAHELGHGIHQYLSRSQGYFQMDTPLTMAETASIFAEMLVFHQLKNMENDPIEKIYLISSKCEDAFSTLFRQVVLTRFEEKFHLNRRTEGEVPAEEINRFWQDVNRPMFGESLQLTEDYGWWWMYISHFIHSPFYCYAYAFGELLVLSLYGKYLKEKGDFVSKYIRLLSQGGSKKPQELLSDFQINLSEKSFWESGLEILNGMVVEAESLAKKIS
ncbi:MAG: M3 family oligoendopeptidase [Nitrospiria bacterium]